MNMLEFNQLFGTDQSLNTSNEELDIECFLEANEECTPQVFTLLITLPTCGIDHSYVLMQINHAT